MRHLRVVVIGIGLCGLACSGVSGLIESQIEASVPDYRDADDTDAPSADVASAPNDLPIDLPGSGWTVRARSSTDRLAMALDGPGEADAVARELERSLVARGCAAPDVQAVDDVRMIRCDAGLTGVASISVSVTPGEHDGSVIVQLSWTAAE